MQLWLLSLSSFYFYHILSTARTTIFDSPSYFIVILSSYVLSLTIFSIILASLLNFTPLDDLRCFTLWLEKTDN